MKYVTADGEEFERMEDAEAHERWLDKDAQCATEVDRYLGMKNDMTDKTRTRDRRIILRYLAYDVRQRPWRYEGEPQESVAPIRKAMEE